MKNIICLLILFSANIFAGQQPWNTIPWEIAAEGDVQRTSYYDTFGKYSSMDELMKATCERRAKVWEPNYNKCDAYNFDSWRDAEHKRFNYYYYIQVCDSLNCGPDESKRKSGNPIGNVETKTVFACTDQNYPIGVDTDNDGQPNKCNRGGCSSVNSDGDLVIKIGVGGQPSAEQVQKGELGCMKTGAQGEHCVTQAVEKNGLKYWTHRSSETSSEQAGQICGDLDATSEGGEGTEATGVDDDVDYCYASEGRLNCYRNPDEVCPGGVCKQGCAKFGDKAICTVDTGVGGDPSSPSDPATPPTGWGEGDTNGNGTGGGTSTDPTPDPDPTPTPGGEGDGDDENPCDPSQFYIGKQCVDFPEVDVQTAVKDLNTTEIESQIDSAKNDLKNLYTSISDSMKSKFNINLSGGNYSQNVKTIKGVQVDFGISRFMAHFDIGNVVIFIYSMMAFFVILGGRE